MRLPTDSLPRSRWGQPPGLLPGTFCLRPPAIRPCARPPPRPSLAHGSPCHAAFRAPATPSCSRARRRAAVSPQAALTSTYSPAVKASVAAAGREAQAAGCLQVQPCHLVLGLMDACLGTAPAPTAPSFDAFEMRPGRAGGKGCTLGALLESCGLTREHVRTILSSEAGEHEGTGSSVALSDEAAQVLFHARRVARMQGVDVAQPGHLLYGLLQVPRHSSTNPLVALVEDAAVKVPYAAWATLQQVAFASFAGVDVAQPGHLLYGLLQLPRHRSTNPLVALVEDAAVKVPYAAWATLQQVAFAPTAAGAEQHGEGPAAQPGIDPPQQLGDSTSPTTSMLLQLGLQSIPNLSVWDLAEALTLVPKLHGGPGQDVMAAITRSVNEKQASLQHEHPYPYHPLYSPSSDWAAWSQLLTAAMETGVGIPVNTWLQDVLAYHVYRLLESQPTVDQGLDLLAALVWHDTLAASRQDSHTNLAMVDARMQDCQEVLMVLKQLSGRSDMWYKKCSISARDPLLVYLLGRAFYNIAYASFSAISSNLTVGFVSLMIELCQDHQDLNRYVGYMVSLLRQLTQRNDPGALASHAAPDLDVKCATRLLRVAVQHKVALTPSVLAATAGTIHNNLRSHTFGPQEAFLAITSLRQLGYDPGAGWMSSFLLQLTQLTPLLSPSQLVNIIAAAGSYPHSRTVLQPHTATVLLEASVSAAGSLTASQRVEIVQGLTGLGLQQHLWDSQFAAKCCATAAHASPTADDRLLAPVLSVMLEAENSSSVVQKLLATPPPSPASQEHGAVPPVSRALPSSTALLCQALTQQYFQQQQQAAASAPSDAQALTSTLMSWVAAAAAAAGSGKGASTPAAASALLSASLHAPLSPRQALLMAWGAAVLGLQPPDGWVEAMWERVRPVAGGGRGGGDMHGRGLLEGDRALLVWAFNALQQATTQGAVLEAATLPPPSTSSPLALSSALWALAQTRPPPQPLASFPGTAAAPAAGLVAVPWQWMEQIANALTAELSDAVAGGEHAGKEGGGVEAAEAEGCRFKACVSGLLSLGQLGYRLGGGGEEAEGAAAEGDGQRLRQAIRTRCVAIHAWAQQAKGSGEEGRAAAEVQAALAAVGV